MTGTLFTITHVLSYLAALECFLAGLLVCALCLLPTQKQSGSNSTASLPFAERWWFVLVLRLAGLGAFLLATSLNYASQTFHKGSNKAQLIAALAGLAAFVLGEAFGARKAVLLLRNQGGKVQVFCSMGLHVILMCVLAHAALFAWSTFPQAGVPYPSLVLKWDPLYVLVSVFISVLLAALLSRFIKQRLDLRALEYVAGGFSSFIICTYFLLVPLQARYLVLMAPVSADGSVEFNLEYFATEARVEALRRLTPYLSSFGALDGLKPAWWDAVTIDLETPNDPVYLEQLRRAAQAGQRSSLERLWARKPSEARDIAEQLLIDAESPKTVHHFVLGEGPAVLFLEQPDRPVFETVIPDFKLRTLLRDVLMRWTKAEEDILVAAHPALLKTTTCYPRMEAYYQLQRKLFDPQEPSWLTHDGEEMPEELQLAAVDFIAFTDSRRAYQLLGCSREKIAVRAMHDIIQSAYNRGRLVVDPWNRAAGIDMEEVLGNIHQDVAIACMREMVRECTESAVLTGWAFSANRPWPELEKHADYILTHWDEIVPRAKRMDGRGVRAQTAFITERLNNL
jgi:hypothetical protein